MEDGGGQGGRLVLSQVGVAPAVLWRSSEHAKRGHGTGHIYDNPLALTTLSHEEETRAVGNDSGGSFDSIILFFPAVCLGLGTRRQASVGVPDVRVLR